MSTTVVVPAYNAESTLARVILLARIHCQEVIAVDDGSTDGTRTIAGGAGAHVFSFPENKGKAEALRKGIRLSLQRGADYIVTIDADGEHDPSDIPRILHPIKAQGAHAVFGVRERTHGANLATSRPTQSILRQHFRIDLKDAMCGFRAYTASAALRLLNGSSSSGFAIDFELAILTVLLRLPYAEVDISTADLQRTAGIRASHFDGFCSNLKKFKNVHDYDNRRADAEWLERIASRDDFLLPIGEGSYRFKYDDRSGLFILS